MLYWESMGYGIKMNRPEHSHGRNHSPSMRCVFSVDVEDWFHILDIPQAPAMHQWGNLASRVENNFRRLLETLEQKQVKATCFFLGWIAERYPRLVKEADTAGHEIASHGYSHRLAYEMTEREFCQDVTQAKELLEDITGKPVAGFRSAGFSATNTTPWFFDILAQAGYRYDSSLFPAPRGHGGMRTGKFAPYQAGDGPDGIIEFPITVAKILGWPICFFGGGYLRLFPYRIIKTMASKVLQNGRPVIFYVHPREVDPHHPRLPMSPIRRFKSYVNLETTIGKIDKLLGDFEWATFVEYIAADEWRRGVD